MVDGQVADQAHTIGVVPPYATLIQQDQGIHRAGTHGPVAQLIGQAPGLLFEGHGDIQPMPPLLEKLANIAFKVVEIPQ